MVYWRRIVARQRDAADGGRRERDGAVRTRGQLFEFARSGYPDFDFMIPNYADGSVGDTSAYPLSADDLVERR